MSKRNTALGEYDASLFEKKDAKEEKKKRYTHVNVDRHEKGTITLPKGMSYGDARVWLEKKEEEEQTEVAFQREFQCHPNDGVVALSVVLKEVFGWQELKAERTFFGRILPRMIQVETDYKQFVSVPWGRMALPGIKGWVQTYANFPDRREEEYNEGEDADFSPTFVLYGEVWKRDIPKLETIADLVEDYVRNNSIYQGKAITSRREFIDISSVKEDDLIFGPSTLSQINTSVFTPIEQTIRVREAGIPLKRGVLLEGPYGTGKTFTAYVTAKKAVENNWTFILVHPKDSLSKALNFARQYQPCVVFMEDVDDGVGGEKRTGKINKVLNTIDGIVVKGTDIMTILTTNHVEKINKAMMRPGRLDAIVHVGVPEPEAIEALILKYGRGLIPEGEDISEAVGECSGMIPATIREVVERAKLYAISNSEKGEVIIHGPDLAESGRQMQHHLELMKGKDKVQPTSRLLLEVNGTPADQE